MNFCVHDHQQKSRYLTAALHAAGHRESPAHAADVLLVDIDDPDAPGRSVLIDACPGAVVLYPHGALATYHGYYQPDPRIDVQLVHGPGTASLVDELGLGRRVVTVGWSYSPSVPFTRPAKVRRVLFGPTHPYGSGQLADIHRDENRRVHDALRRLDVDLMVQMFGTPEMNGLPDLGWFIPSSLTVDWAAVDEADLVVADGTLACLALARGKPVVMFGQSLPVMDEHNRPRVGPVAVTPRYPVDFDDGPLPDLLAAACSGAGEEWAAGFVGGPFDEQAFLDAVEPALVAA